MTRSVPLLRLAAALLVLPAAGGCLSDALFGWSDEDIVAELASYRKRAQREWASGLVLPRRRPAVVEPAAGGEPPSAPDGKAPALEIDLTSALCLATTGRLPGEEDGSAGREPDARLGAFREDYLGAGGGRPGNRSFLTRRENLRRSALSLASSEHEWNPQVAGTLRYVFSSSRYTGPRQDASSGTLSFDVSQKLPFGGSASLGLDGGQDQNHTDTADRSASLGMTGSVTQPLLKGFGYGRARESLVQARRSLLYAVREFELYRQDFTIDVMRRYYELIRQGQVVKNNRHAFDQARFLLDQTRALYQRLGEKTTLDVLRAELREQQARDALEEAQRAYEEAVDLFKQFLGLDPAVTLRLRDERPAFREVDFDPDSAVEAALANRLDLRNGYQRLQDAARSLRYARQDLWPSLDLHLNVSFYHPTAEDFDEISGLSHSFSADLSLDIPLDRVAERNALRSQVIAFGQQVRDFQLEVDSVRRQVRNGFRTLRRHRRGMENQVRQIEIAKRKVRKAELDFEEGLISNRDLVEAQEELRDAENSLIQAQVSYEIARVQLYRDLGILRLTGAGIVQED